MHRVCLLLWSIGSVACRGTAVEASPPASSPVVGAVPIPTDRVAPPQRQAVERSALPSSSGSAQVAPKPQCRGKALVWDRALIDSCETDAAHARSTVHSDGLQLTITISPPSQRTGGRVVVSAILANTTQTAVSLGLEVSTFAAPETLEASLVDLTAFLSGVRTEPPCGAFGAPDDSPPSSFVRIELEPGGQLALGDIDLVLELPPIDDKCTVRGFPVGKASVESTLELADGTRLFASAPLVVTRGRSGRSSDRR